MADDGDIGGLCWARPDGYEVYSIQWDAAHTSCNHEVVSDLGLCAVHLQQIVGKAA